MKLISYYADLMNMDYSIIKVWLQYINKTGRKYTIFLIFKWLENGISKSIKNKINTI